MAARERFRRRPATEGPSDGRSGSEPPVDAREESRLTALLHEDPNDANAFHRLADIVRRRAAEGHQGGDLQRAENDAVWALAEELAHSHRAWYPLVELARLSVHDDREAALRRLGTAAERDSTGQALAIGLQMLRDAQMPAEALGIGVGHWRPREHDVEAGRQLVEAAVEAGRVGEARRHLEALASHPDQGRVQPIQQELERLIARSERSRPSRGPATPATTPPATRSALPPGEPGSPWSVGSGGTPTSGPGTGGLPLLDPKPDVVDLRERDLRERPPEERGAVLARLRDIFRRR